MPLWAELQPLGSQFRSPLPGVGRHEPELVVVGRAATWTLRCCSSVRAKVDCNPSSGCPRIEDSDIHVCEIAGVACDQGQIVPSRHRGNLRICHGLRASEPVTIAHDLAPNRCRLLIEG